MKKPLITLATLAVFGTGCLSEDGSEDILELEASNVEEAYAVLEAAVQYLLDDYDRADARLLATHGPTGVRASVPETPYAIAFVPFKGGPPRPPTQPAQKEVIFRDPDGTESGRIHATEPYDPLMPGTVEAWDALAKVMRTTEAWEYSPWDRPKGRTNPRPDQHTMILRVADLMDDGRLHSGVKDDGVYYLFIEAKKPWEWHWSGKWMRPLRWEGHHLTVSRIDDGWRVSRPQRPISLQAVHGDHWPERENPQ